MKIQLLFPWLSLLGTCLAQMLTHQEHFARLCPQHNERTIESHGHEYRVHCNAVAAHIGNDNRVQGVEIAEKCAQICTVSAPCKAVIWRGSNGGCWVVEQTPSPYAANGFLWLEPVNTLADAQDQLEKCRQDLSACQAGNGTPPGQEDGIPPLPPGNGGGSPPPDNLERNCVEGQTFWSGGRQWEMKCRKVHRLGTFGGEATLAEAPTHNRCIELCAARSDCNIARWSFTAGNRCQFYHTADGSHENVPNQFFQYAVEVR